VLLYPGDVRGLVHSNQENIAGDDEARFRIDGTEGAIRGTLGLLSDYPHGRPDTLELWSRTLPTDGWLPYPVTRRWVPDAFLGPVASVQCQSTTALLDIEVEDTAAALIRFQSGALGVFEATVAARPDNLEGSLSILGEKGTVVAEGVAVNEIRTWRFEEEQAFDKIAKDEASKAVPNVYGLGHTNYIFDVIRHIRDGIRIPSLCDGKGGRENIKTLTALYESAASDGQAVVPGAPGQHSLLGSGFAGGVKIKKTAS
jgi:predicted dehydrogenase